MAKKRKRLCKGERDVILYALRSLVVSHMDTCAGHGIPIDDVTTAVEEAAVNWQHDQRRAKAKKARKS